MSGTAASGALLGIPEALRAELLGEYEKIVKNFRQCKWEPSELGGGKFCEVVYSILHGYMSGTWPAQSSKPSNMLQSCLDLAQFPKAQWPHSFRVLIPRVLTGLYDVRNNRGVGHVGGDVDPNKMDATMVIHSASWVMAELVRVFHDVSLEDAQAIVDALVERASPLIWQVDGRRRVLDPSMRLSDKVYLLLYDSAGPCDVAELMRSLEYADMGYFRRLLLKAHKNVLVNFNEVANTAEISPVGVQYVETSVLS